MQKIIINGVEAFVVYGDNIDIDGYKNVCELSGLVEEARKESIPVFKAKKFKNGKEKILKSYGRDLPHFYVVSLDVFLKFENMAKEKKAKDDACRKEIEQRNAKKNLEDKERAMQAIKAGNFEPFINKWGDMDNKGEIQAIKEMLEAGDLCDASDIPYKLKKEMIVFRVLIGWADKIPQKIEAIYKKDYLQATDMVAEENLKNESIDKMTCVGRGIKPDDYSTSTHVCRWELDPLYSELQDNGYSSIPCYYRRFDLNLPDNYFGKATFREEVSHEKKTYTKKQTVSIKFYDGHEAESVLIDLTMRHSDSTPYQGWAEWAVIYKTEDDFLSSRVFDVVSKNKKVKNWYKG